MYSLEVKKFNRGDILQKPGDNASVLYFIQDGVIEILTETEGGHEFVLEKLFRGSIINYRTFFMEDSGKVFYRFGRNTICSQIDFKTMINVMSRHKDLLKVFKRFKNKTTSLQKTFPLDYIMTIPKHL